MILERSQLKRIVEAALFAAGQPMSLEKLGELFYEEERPSNEIFREILAEIEADYSERGVQLKEVANGYRFQACQEVGEWVSRLWEEKPQRYSRALLETLALIAYRQPITRGEVEDIRGVSVSSHIIKTLQEREWVRVLGYRDVPGRPAMYGTTKTFLDYFNLKSLEDLPTLAEVRDLDKISAELDERLQLAQPQAALPLEAIGEPVDEQPASFPLASAVEESTAMDTAIEVVERLAITESIGATSENTDIPHRKDPGASSSIFDSQDDNSTVNSPTVVPEPVATTVPNSVTTPIVATISLPAESTNSVVEATIEPAPTAASAAPTTKPPTTFSTLRARFASLFDAPAEPVPEPVPASAATSDITSSDDEIPPSPIQPNDPRLE